MVAGLGTKRLSVCVASSVTSIFNWGNKFNITMTLDAEEGSQYPTGLEYPLSDPADVKAPEADD